MDDAGCYTWRSSSPTADPPDLPPHARGTNPALQLIRMTVYCSKFAQFCTPARCHRSPRGHSVSGRHAATGEIERCSNGLGRGRRQAKLLGQVEVKSLRVGMGLMKDLLHELVVEQPL